MIQLVVATRWPPELRKLLRRIDTADYISMLESQLSDLGVDIDSLRASATDLLLNA